MVNRNRLYARLALFAGFATIVFSYWFSVNGAKEACTAMAPKGSVMIAFEFARSAGDLANIFGTGTDGCGEALRANLQQQNLVDFLFMPTYCAFMAFAIAGLAGGRSRLAGIGCAILALVSDGVETLTLLQIDSVFRSGIDILTINQAATHLPQLMIATSLKFLGISLAVASAGGLFWARGCRSFRILALMCVPALPATALAIAAPQLAPQILGPAIGLGWIALLTASFNGARKAPVIS